MGCESMTGKQYYYRIGVAGYGWVVNYPATRQKGCYVCSNMDQSIMPGAPKDNVRVFDLSHLLCPGQPPDSLNGKHVYELNGKLVFWEEVERTVGKYDDFSKEELKKILDRAKEARKTGESRKAYWKWFLSRVRY